MKEDLSFGVIPLTLKEGIWHVFLIQHRKGGYWGFPKGHAELGEKPEQAAFRELQEETALEVVSLLIPDPFIESYQFLVKGEKILKTVSYFVCEVRGESMLQEGEISDGKWVPLSQGHFHLTHLESQGILWKVIQALENR